MLHLEGAAPAAAVVRAGKLHIFDARNGFQDIPGLGADLLPFYQMAGIVIGDAELRAVGLHLRQPLLVLVDKDGHILELAGQQFRRPDLLIGHLLAELAQIAEQVGYSFLSAAPQVAQSTTTASTSSRAKIFRVSRMHWRRFPGLRT